MNSAAFIIAILSGMSITYLTGTILGRYSYGTHSKRSTGRR